ncbi:hypothetical protein ATY30_28555 [Sinorhizobium americanum]|nr:hypothetical protein CO664_24270 [Sinorhizobium sp. NG07B]POH24997.1 hypothetical protein ATY30_28555 [Sinorhizobium americanum]
MKLISLPDIIISLPVYFYLSTGKLAFVKLGGMKASSQAKNLMRQSVIRSRSAGMAGVQTVATVRRPWAKLRKCAEFRRR